MVSTFMEHTGYIIERVFNKTNYINETKIKLQVESEINGDKASICCDIVYPYYLE